MAQHTSGTYTLTTTDDGRLWLTFRNDRGEQVSEVTIGADYRWTLTPLPLLSEQVREAVRVALG